MSRRKADDLLIDFRRWLAADQGTAAAEPDDVVATLQMLLQAAHDPGGTSLLMPPDPDFVVAMVEDVIDQDDDVRVPVVETIHDYLHFLQEHPQYAGDPDALIRCFDVVHRVLDLIYDPAEMLAGVFEPKDEAAARQVEQELRESQLVKAVDELLAWLGPGKPVTGAGGLRRADIEPVAAMLGILARGVNSKYNAEGRKDSGLQGLFEMSSSAGQQTELRVQSMWEIEELTAWWQALGELELLEFGSTKVYPGPAIDDWVSEDVLVAVAIRQELVAVFISELLALEAEPYQNAGVAGLFAQKTIPTVAQLLLQMIDPGEDFTTDQPGSFGVGMLRAKILFETFERQGVVHQSENGYWVPDGLRAAVAQAVLDISRRFLGAGADY